MIEIKSVIQSSWHHYHYYCDHNIILTAFINVTDIVLMWMLMLLLISWIKGLNTVEYNTILRQIIRKFHIYPKITNFMFWNSILPSLWKLLHPYLDWVLLLPQVDKVVCSPTIFRFKSEDEKDFDCQKLKIITLKLAQTSFVCVEFFYRPLGSWSAFGFRRRFGRSWKLWLAQPSLVSKQKKTKILLTMMVWLTAGNLHRAHLPVERVQLEVHRAGEGQRHSDAANI